MLIQKIYKNTALLSPRVEVLLRGIYWKNVRRLSKFSPNSSNGSKRIYRSELVHFDEILEYIYECGIRAGNVLILHSSYGSLKPIDKMPQEILQCLLALLGEKGTLAAPVIRQYAEDDRTLDERFEGGKKSPICMYDVQSTPITSGVLSKTLMDFPNSETSKFPINPLTAVGNYAKEMMSHNLDGELPSAHGPNSCWKFCADKDAFILYLGVDYGHHLTMQQVIAECNPDWDIPNFYETREFMIKDNNSIISKVIKERALKMTMYLAEENVRRDLCKSGIIKMKDIKGIPIRVVKTSDLLNFYSKKQRYYPYYF